MDFSAVQKDVWTGDPGIPLQSLSQIRVVLTIFVEENERICMCTLFVLFEGFI